MGRPSKLDDLTAARILKALRQGSSRRAAANAALVSWTTLQNWLRAGRAGESPYAEFLVRVQHAEADAEIAVSTVVYQLAVGGDLKACQTWLGTRRPKDWAQNSAAPPTEEDESPAGAMETDEAVLTSLLAAAQSRKVGT